MSERIEVNTLRESLNWWEGLTSLEKCNVIRAAHRDALLAAAAPAPGAEGRPYRSGPWQAVFTILFNAPLTHDDVGMSRAAAETLTDAIFAALAATPTPEPER